MFALLTRETFKHQVFHRSRGRCVLCGEVAVDAHHILDRKLFANGGYFLENGAAVCGACHWDCETTEVSPDEVRTAAGIADVVIPDGWDPEKHYDKWGNEVLPGGLRRPGPLFHGDGTQKALAKGRVLGKFV